MKEVPSQPWLRTEYSFLSWTYARSGLVAEQVKKGRCEPQCVGQQVPKSATGESDGPER
jgi:hypothetical protein